MNVIRDQYRAARDNYYVYAVVSRRSKGISIGIDLNPDKVCNFDCVYCQVDRKTPPVVRGVDESRLLAELEEMLDRVRSGELFENECFHETPQDLHRLKDIAFAGGGEPTTYPRFLQVVEKVASLRRQRALDEDDSHRRSVLNVLRGQPVPGHWARMVEEVTELEGEEQSQMFGESLPIGLRLIGASDVRE